MKALFDAARVAVWFTVAFLLAYVVGLTALMAGAEVYAR